MLNFMTGEVGVLNSKLNTYMITNLLLLFRQTVSNG